MQALMSKMTDRKTKDRPMVLPRSLAPFLVLHGYRQPPRILVYESLGNAIKSEANESQVGETATKSKQILITGHCGVGKSALLQNMIKCAMENKILQNVDLIICLDLTKQEVLDLATPEDIIDYLGVEEDLKTSVFHRLQGNGENLIFFFDGWKERPNYRKSFISKVLEKVILKKCSIILTCRPSGCFSLCETAFIDAQFEVKGLHTSGIPEYLKMKAKDLDIAYYEAALSFLMQQDALYDMCSNPLLANVLLGLHKSNQLLSHTDTEVLNSIVTQVIKRETEGEIAPPDTWALPPNTQRQLKTIGKLAWTDLGVKKELDKRELSYFSLQEASPGIEHTRGLGLLESEVYRRLSDRSLSLSYSFLHSSLQEYLASLHLVHQPMKSQLKFFCEKSLTLLEEYANVTRYFFGMTHFESRLCTSSSFSPAKLGLGSILDCLVHELELEDQPVVTRLLFLLHCLYEAHEESLVRKFVKRYENLLTISLGGCDLSECDYSSLAFLVSHSGISKWQVEVSNRAEKETAEHLAFRITCSSTSSTVDIRIEDGSSFILRPAETSSKKGKRAEKKLDYSLHGLFCQSAKDILHQVLQLFSPVRIHSNSSDPSYLSFIACSCLQQAVETSIEFEPTPAIHWVPLPPKSRSQQKKQSSEAEAAQHHLEMHDMARMELIILTTPYLGSIRFTLPGTDKQVIIALSSENESSVEEGINTKRIAGHEAIQVTDVTPVQESGHIGNSEIVAPPMPLPRKQQSDTTTTTITTTFRHSDSPRVQTNGEREARDREMVAEHPVLSPFYSHYATVTTESAAAQTSRQFSRSPGTIVFSTLPEVFRQENVYPLPDEADVIRRGGNGEVFGGVYFGISLAVKKTTFRLREFNIVTKLSHKNICPILAIMVGGQHPVHKRRHLCYYFMPRLTGDCARMVTDHQDLTMKALCKKYRNSPMELGVVQGNLRYLIAEALRGLSYLHSLHIVHRDVKASNILLKLHCSCDGPLSCRCSNKCRVVLSDFDSSCELQSNGHLAPIRSVLGRDTYYLMPVGTTGFRPPESSFLVVANDSNAIAPQLTTAADIWGVGVLLLRMLIGRDGPSSQRQIAMLLLHYHQQKGMREGRHSHPLQPVLVDETEIAHLLKLNKLRKELRSMPAAVDFVHKCLVVDPAGRATAEELLKHPFL